MARALVYPAPLFLLNAYICHELFGLEYQLFRESGEAAYIGISRYILDNWGDLSWWPLWYGGVPFENTYPPLLHAIVAAAAGLVEISTARSHHAVTAFFYCLGPVALYWLAVRLSGSAAWSFAAGLVYSLLSPAALLMPFVARELGSPWGARRLQALVYYGDGPHLTALALVPLAVLLLDAALVKRRPAYYLLAALSMAAVALSNWLGAFALAAACVAYLCSLPVNAGRQSSWLRALGIAALAYLLASPLLPPSNIRAIQLNARTVAGNYSQTYLHLPVFVALAGVIIWALLRLFRRAGTTRVLKFSVIFSLFMGGVTLAWAWGGVSIVPQPHRYQIEMEMAFALAAVFAVRPLAKRIPVTAQVVLAAGLLIACAVQLWNYRSFAGNWIRPGDITQTIEYKTAKWFDENMAGRRVLAPGSTSFWLNNFTDTPQLGGGFDQGVTNPVNRMARDFIFTTQDPAAAVIWLKAFGVHAVAVGGPNSGEFWRPFRHPEIYAKVLDEAWREGDDAIYWVPQRSAALAHVVRRDELVRQTPASGANLDLLRAYVSALDDPTRPPAELRWRNRRAAEITANLEPGNLVSVQISYHPGWHATVNALPRRVFADGIGQIAVEPECAGPCTIELVYDGGPEALFTRWLSILALLGCVIWAVAARFTRANRERVRESA